MVAERLRIHEARGDEYAQIDAIRAKFSPPASQREAGVRYMVAERNHVVTAFYGLKVEDGRALVVDFYGTNARDWERLLALLLRVSDEERIELSAWVAINNKNLKYFFKRGFAPHFVLIRRQPEHKDVK